MSESLRKVSESLLRESFQKFTEGFPKVCCGKVSESLQKVFRKGCCGKVSESLRKVSGKVAAGKFPKVCGRFSRKVVAGKLQPESFQLEGCWDGC